MGGPWPTRGLLSSHRILTTGTHSGDGLFGPPSGKSFAIRAIADCLVRAAHEQIMRSGWCATPAASPRSSASTCARWASVWRLPTPPRGRSRGISACGTRCARVGPKRTRSSRIIRRQCLRAGPSRRSSTTSTSARSAGRTTGFEPAWARAPALRRDRRTQLYWLGMLASLPDARLVVDHAIALEEPGQPIRTSTRWRLAGTHAGHGSLGPASGAKVLILGITRPMSGRPHPAGMDRRR